MPQRYCGTPKNANFYKRIRWNLSTYKIIDENRGKQDIWSDEAKQAIELFNHGDKIIRKQCPAMLLYKSLCDASKLLEKIIKEECINDSTCKEICACANNVCNGLDCDYSVRDILTHNKPININMWITEIP